MARTQRASPAELTPGWPSEPSPDPIAEVARRFAVSVQQEMGGRSIRSVADAAGISHVSLLSIFAGRTWPDLATIARIERAMGTDVWPGRVI